MSKMIVSTDRAPAAIGPYSQATASGGLLFISGQIPLVPETGEIVEGGFREQVRQVLANFEAVVHAGGLRLENVVKTTVYLTDFSQFQDFNTIYAELFSIDPPARAVVEVSALPKGVMVEMEGIAVIG